MELPRSLRIVSYAVNGRGLGHLVRQVSLHRWMRRYAAFAGVRTEHWFLTTSEADTLLHFEGFAGFKLPSKSVVEPAGIDKASYLGLAKQWVWHSVGLLRPDLLIVDTFPEGSFGELPSVLDLCKHTALVLRPVKEGFSRLGGFRAAVPLYERVIVPTSGLSFDDDDEARACAEIAEWAGPRVRRVGPTSLFERFDALPREDARRALGVPEGALALLVTGGGGGDDDVRALFERALAAAGDDANVHLIFAAGPLYRGAPVRGSGARVTWWTSHDLARYLGGVDAAVSAAGFNATHELLLAGVPTLLVPQRKIADDQHARAERLARLGLALSGDLEAAAFQGSLRALLDEARRAELRERLAAAGLRNHARDAAAQLLELLLPRSLVRHAQEELGDAPLARAAAAQVGVPELTELAATLSARGAEDRASLDLEPALDLVERTRSLGASPAELCRAARALYGKRRGRDVEPEEAGEALAGLVEHPACFGQVSSLGSLLDALSLPKETSALDAAESVRRVLDASLSAGRPLVEVAAQASRRERGSLSARDLVSELAGAPPNGGPT